jgi:hypothetical protein
MDVLFCQRFKRPHQIRRASHVKTHELDAQRLRGCLNLLPLQMSIRVPKIAHKGQARHGRNHLL